MPLSIIFAGTPDFAAVTLTALLESRHTVTAVYTQPDRPRGRGRQLSASAVKQVAETHGIPLFQPDHFKAPETLEDLQAQQADVMVVVAYGQLLPAAVLTIPRYGCLNVHASLLPRWRGAAPIERAIEAGDSETGISIMQMDEHLDTGDILAQAVYPMAMNETSHTLSSALADLGAKTLLETLDQLEKNSLQPRAQNHQDASYAAKLTKQEAKLDWQLSAAVLARKIRAFNPRPVAFTELDGQLLRIWQAIAPGIPTTATPGTVLANTKDGRDIATGAGILRLQILQKPGGRPHFIYREN